MILEFNTENAHSVCEINNKVQNLPNSEISSSANVHMCNNNVSIGKYILLNLTILRSCC